MVFSLKHPTISVGRAIVPSLTPTNQLNFFCGKQFCHDSDNDYACVPCTLHARLKSDRTSCMSIQVNRLPHPTSQWPFLREALVCLLCGYRDLLWKGKRWPSPWPPWTWPLALLWSIALGCHSFSWPQMKQWAMAKKLGVASHIGLLYTLRITSVTVSWESVRRPSCQQVTCNYLDNSWIIHFEVYFN